MEKHEKGMYLSSIRVALTGTEEIYDHKGDISYYFYKKNVARNIDAQAQVDIDMRTNSINFVSVSYGTPKELGGGEAINVQNWNQGVDQLVNIALNNMGEKEVKSISKPQILMFFGDETDVCLMDKSESADNLHYIWEIRIDSNTGKVVSKHIY